MFSDYHKKLSIQKSVELFNWYRNDKPNGDYVKFSNDNSSERSVRNFDYWMQPPLRRVVSTNGINMSTNKKRDIKDKLKKCQSIIDKFILSKSNLLDRS